MSAPQRAYRIGLEPSRGLSGRMCRMSRPSGRFHDVTFAPCMFTCSHAIGMKWHRSTQEIALARSDSVRHEGLALACHPAVKKGNCRFKLSVPLEHKM